MKSDQYKIKIRESSTADMEKMLQEERKNLFMSVRDSATKQLENTKRIRQIKKNIARIQTIMREREIEAAEGTQ